MPAGAAGGLLRSPGHTPATVQTGQPKPSIAQPTRPGLSCTPEPSLSADTTLQSNQSDRSIFSPSINGDSDPPSWDDTGDVTVGTKRRADKDFDASTPLKRPRLDDMTAIAVEQNLLNTRPQIGSADYSNTPFDVDQQPLVGSSPTPTKVVIHELANPIARLTGATVSHFMVMMDSSTDRFGAIDLQLDDNLGGITQKKLSDIIKRSQEEGPT